MIRPYHVNDSLQLLKILRANTPKYFSPEEEKDYQSYLQTELDQYFVFEIKNQIVGAGGINKGFDGGKTARIAWDLIHPEFQGQGIGRKLTQFRIAEIKKNELINKIVVRTSQIVYPFYEKNGFILEKVVKDYWDEGYDLYEMTIHLKEC